MLRQIDIQGSNSWALVGDIIVRHCYSSLLFVDIDRTWTMIQDGPKYFIHISIFISKAHWDNCVVIHLLQIKN